MKKIIAIILAAIMAFGFAAVAMAVGTGSGITLDQNTTSQDVIFSIVIPSTFTWSIPNFTPAVTDATITAAGDLEFWDIYKPDAGDIAVTITSKNGDCFKDELDNELPYTLTAPNPVAGKDSYYLLGALDYNGEHAKFNVSLVASRKDHYTAGTFSDQLTFSAQSINLVDENITYSGGVWTYAG